MIPGFFNAGLLIRPQGGCTLSAAARSGSGDSAWMPERQ
jgi:uncharacterized membrane protein YedE/YeeE